LNILLDASSCVRYYAKNSQCNLCEEICPTDAVEVGESLVSLYQDRCIGCGGCVGVCPTEALSLPNLNISEFFFDFLKSDESVLSCKSNFVCLAGLNVEYLIALSTLKEITLDLGHCQECEISKSCLAQIEKNITEANITLSAIGVRGIKKEYLGLVKTKDKDTNRREFFNIFSLKGAVETKRKFDASVEALQTPQKKLSSEITQAIREKKIPQKRKLLFTVLKRVKKPSSYISLYENEISFVSTKSIDDSCDNCSLCYRLCPTSALSSDAKHSKILFDDMMCVKCKLCHDVCERDSIKLEKFSTKEFFEPSEKELKRFDIVKCDECGNPFTFLGGERICRRCRIEEEEAKSLWGLS
jgi:ferredoxin